MPDSDHPEGGTFLLADQENGKIYEIQIPIKSRDDSGVVLVVSLFSPLTNHGTLCKLIQMSIHRF